MTVESRLDLFAVKTLRKLFVQSGFGLIHAHDVKASVYALLASFPNRDWRLVSTHHGVKGRYNTKLAIYEQLYRYLALPFFDLVLAVSPTDFETIRNFWPLSAKTRLHENGLTLPPVLPENKGAARDRILNSWGIDSSQGELILGVVARHSPEKRINVVIKVFAQLSQSLKCRLIVVGDGPLTFRLQQEAVSLGVQDKVHWMGYNSKINEEMAAFDLLLSLSKNEGLPLVLLEAALSCTPVLATGVGGQADLIDHGSNGVLVSLSDSEETIAQIIYSLSGNREAMEKMAEALQGKVLSHYSQEKWLKDLRAIYDELGVTMNVS